MTSSGNLQYIPLSRPTQPHLVHQIKHATPSLSINSQDTRILCVIDPSAPDSSNLVGYTAYIISPSPSKPVSRSLMVQSVFVRPENRRQKIGRSLLSHMRQVATEEKCNAIYVDTGGEEDGTGTKQFLERNGFEEWKWKLEEEIGSGETGGTVMWHAVALF